MKNDYQQYQSTSSFWQQRQQQQAYDNDFVKSLHEAFRQQQNTFANFTRSTSQGTRIEPKSTDIIPEYHVINDKEASCEIVPIER